MPRPLVQPVACQLPPRCCASIGAAGQPALLPAAAVLTRQPVQQCLQPACIAGQQASQALCHLVADCAVAGHPAAAGRGGNRVRAAW